jgi:hypothetical protein
METTRSQRIWALMAAVAAASPSVASAQFTTATSSTHHWLAVGLGFGDIIPTGNATQDYSGSFQGQAYVVINLGILPELRFNLGYQRMNLSQQLLTQLGYPTTVSGYNSVLSGIAGTRIDLIRGPVRPYLTLGVGAFNFRSNIDSAGASGYKAATSTNPTSALQFGLDGGAGLAVHVGRFEAFGEGRIQNIYTNHGFISSARQIQAIPITFGFLYSII